MPKLDNQAIQLLILGVVALALFFQTVILFAVLIVLRKTAKTMNARFEEVRTSVMPIVENTRELLADVTPKIVEASADMAALAKSLRAQTADVQTAATEIVARVRTQTGRIDSLLSSTLDTLERATGFMSDTLAKPMRQLGGLLASAKAVVESLRSSESASRSQRNQSSSDNDLFV